MFSLKGKRAIVTGGASGIGLAVAEAMIDGGADVVLADIVDASEVAAGIGAHAVICNVADEASVLDAFVRAAELLGGDLDVVVLNAGVGDVGPSIRETESEHHARVTDINYNGVFFGLKVAPGFMNDHGSIICTASMAAFISLPGAASYSGSKRGVLSLVETAALELGRRGIRVNAVCPGYTATAMGSGEEGEKICASFTALGRVAQTEDLAGVYVFLAAPASGYITGQALQVDGGWTCGPTAALLELVTGNAEAPA